MRLPSRTEEENMAIVRDTHAALARGDFESFKAAIGPHYVRHCQAMPPKLQELQGWLSLVTELPTPTGGAKPPSRA